LARRIFSIRVSILISLTLLVCGCSKKEQEVNTLLNQFQQSVVHASYNAFTGCLAPGYTDPIAADKKEAEDDIKWVFKFNLPPSYQILSRKIKIASDGAVVTQEFRFEGIVAGKKRTYQEQEVFVLRQTDKGWKIESGSAVYQILAGRALIEDAIAATLTKRVEALKTKNLELFKTVIDPGYNFNNKTFNILVSQMDGYFKKYDSIELELDPPKIHIHGDRADVIEGYRMRAVSGTDKKEFNDSEKLEFHKVGVGNDWKISKGL
jgi:hypothetical protein